MLVIFFFNDTATTEIYTLSLHDALPISITPGMARCKFQGQAGALRETEQDRPLERYTGFHNIEHVTYHSQRSEEHTSELQSQSNIVCRLLLEKKITIRDIHTTYRHTTTY